MEKYSFDIITKTLTITAKFAKEMDDPESKEYALVVQLQRDFPGLRIAKRTHKTPVSYNNKNGDKTSRNQYKNLTYERMEKFMYALPQKEGYLREYHTVKNMATAILPNGYPLVRKWFEAQFPMYRKNPLFYLNNTPMVVSGSEFLDKETAAVPAA